MDASRSRQPDEAPAPIISCITNGYDDLPAERMLGAIAAAGFRYVELQAGVELPVRYPPERLGERGLREALAQVRDFGLTPVSVSGHADLTTAEGAAALKRRIDVAVVAGAGYVTTGTGHTETDDGAARFFALMPDLAAYAAARGVIIALESHGGLTGTGDRTRMTIERIGSDWVRVNYDPTNVIYYEGLRPEPDLPVIAAYVAHFHVKDSAGRRETWDFPVPGEGTIDFVSLFATLRDAGYQGPYSVELEQHGLTPAEEDAARARAFAFVTRTLAAL
jgi:sugar phosphate isomerase/epimerase